MEKKITLIKSFICLGYVGVPLATCILFFYSPRSWGHIVFLIFMIFHSFERVWETFYTTKEKKAYELHGDWTLAVVTAAYLLLCFITVAECYIKVQKFNPVVTVIGFVFYILAFRIRWWGMRSLGKQWAIHAVGVQKIEKIRLIKIGAFKYIRHPIYLSIMMEVVSIPILANAFWSTLFAIAVNVPLQYMRLVIEEQTSMRRFGDEYVKYKQETDRLVPIKYFKRKIFPQNVSR